MKFIPLCILLIVISSAYIDAVKVASLTRKSDMEREALAFIKRKEKEIKASPDQQKQQQQKNATIQPRNQQQKQQAKISPVSIGMMVAKKVISSVTSFAQKYEKQFKDEMEKAQDVHKEKLQANKKLVDNFIESECLFYQNLKHIVNSHMITLDLQLAITEKSYQVPTKFQFRNSRQVVSRYSSLDKIQFLTTAEDPKFLAEILNYIHEVRLIKDSIVSILNKKKNQACSIEGDQFTNSQQTLNNNDLDAVINDIEARKPVQMKTQKKLVDVVVDKVKQTFLTSEKKKAAEEKKKLEIQTYQTLLYRFNNEVNKDQDIINSKISQDTLIKDFNTLYEGFANVKITDEFNKYSNNNIQVDLYQEKMGYLISVIYVKSVKNNMVKELLESANIKEQKEQLEKSSETMLNIVQALKYLDYARELYGYAQEYILNDKLDKDQKELEKIILSLYDELIKLVKFQLDYSILSTIKTTKNNNADIIALKNARDQQFWKFGKMMAKEVVKILLKGAKASLKMITDIIGNPLDLIISSFEMFESLFNVWKAWKAKNAQQKKFEIQTTLSDALTQNVLLNKQYGRCQTMNYLFDILQKQQIYLRSLQEMTEQNPPPETLVQPVIKDFLVELCNVDIHTCIGTFSLKFLRDLIGVAEADKLINYLMVQSKSGPITQVYATNKLDNEQYLISMGYTLYQEVEETETRVFVCRFCTSRQFIDYIRVYDARDETDLFQKASSDIKAQINQKKLAERSYILTASKILEPTSARGQVKYLVTREVHLEKSVADKEDNILREFKLVLAHKVTGTYEVKQERYQTYQLKGNSWIKDSAYDIPDSNINRDLLKYSSILITRKFKNNDNNCNAKFDPKEREELFNQKYQVEQHFSSYQVFGYFGDSVTQDVHQANLLKKGCDLIYSVSLANIDSYLDGHFYQFRTDFASRNNLYGSSGYKIISPTLFSIPNNPSEYQIFFKPVFQDYNLMEELMLTNKPMFVGQATKSNQLINHVNQYICERSISYENKVKRAQCIFQNEPLSLNIPSSEEPIRNYRTVVLPKDIKLLESGELKALRYFPPKLYLWDWHANHTLQNVNNLNLGLRQITDDSVNIKAIENAFAEMGKKDKGASPRFVFFIPIKFNLFCSSNEDQYVSITKKPEFIKVNQYCQKFDSGNIPIIERFYVRVIIVKDPKARHNNPDTKDFVFLPRQSNSFQVNKEGANFHILVDFLVKPKFEYGNMILTGMGFYSQAPSTDRFALSIKGDNKLFSDKCYNSMLIKTLDSQYIQPFALQNSLNEQQVVQYQLLDDMRQVPSLATLRQDQYFKDFFLTSGYKFNILKQTENNIYYSIEINCFYEANFLNIGNGFYKNHKLNAFTWFIPVRIGSGFNYLSFETIKDGDQTETIKLKEDVVNTQETMPMHQLFYVEFIYNVKNEDQNLNIESHSNYKTLKRYGFTPLIPPRQNYKDYSIITKSKRDIVDRNEFSFTNDDRGSIIARILEYQGMEYNGDEPIYQRIIGFRVWVRYDTRIQGTFEEKCEVNPHVDPVRENVFNIQNEKIIVVQAPISSSTSTKGQQLRHAKHHHQKQQKK